MTIGRFTALFQSSTVFEVGGPNGTLYVSHLYIKYMFGPPDLGLGTQIFKGGGLKGLLRNKIEFRALLLYFYNTFINTSWSVRKDIVYPKVMRILINSSRPMKRNSVSIWITSLQVLKLVWAVDLMFYTRLVSDSRKELLKQMKQNHEINSSFFPKITL